MMLSNRLSKVGLLAAGLVGWAVLVTVVHGSPSAQPSPTSTPTPKPVYLPLAHLFHPGSSEGIVTSLVVSSTPRPADAARVFPLGTMQVYVIYEYQRFAGQGITVTIHGPGLPDLKASPARRYIGAGSDAVRIAGTDIFASLTNVALDESIVAQANVRMAQTHPEVHGYFEMIHRSTYQIERCLALLATLVDQGAIVGDQAENVALVRSASGRVMALVQEALDLPANDLAGKQAVAGQMVGPAKQMVDSAESISAYAATVTEIMLPETSLDQDGFIVVAEVGRIPCITTEFFVVEGDLGR